MRNNVDIDHAHSRAITREIGERLHASLRQKPELPASLKMQIDRLCELEDQSPSIVPGFEGTGPDLFVIESRLVHFLMGTAAHDRSAKCGEAMPSVKLRASTIMNAFGEAQSELIGRAVVLTDGKAGTVEDVWLDDLHGLRISIKGHDGKWPVSTIRFAQS